MSAGRRQLKARPTIHAAPLKHLQSQRDCVLQPSKGCEERATLGPRPQKITNPNGVVPLCENAGNAPAGKIADHSIQRVLRLFLYGGQLNSRFYQGSGRKCFRASLVLLIEPLTDHNFIEIFAEV